MPITIVYREDDGATLIVGSTKDDGQIVASPSAVVFTDPQKVAVENRSDRALGASPSFTGLLLRRVQVGSNDGIGFIRTADDPNGTVSKPWGLDEENSVPTGAPTVVVSAGAGVWAAAQDYGVVVTAVNATGETIASVEKTFTISSLTEEALVDWEDTPDAATYRVFVTDAPGTYGATTLVATALAVSTFNYDGAAPTAGTPPADNTTGGAGPTYGTPPLDGDFGTADLTIASAPEGLAVGQQWFFWMIERLPIGATSLGNKRQGKLFPTEV